MLHGDFAERRKKLLGALDNDSIAILVAAPEVIRNGDSHYLYRQASDFYYFTGLSEGNAVAVFAPGSEWGDFILFNRPKDKLREQWDGKMAGQEGARAIHGADHSFPYADLDGSLMNLMQGRSRVYFDFGKSDLDERVINAVLALRHKVRAGIKAPTDYSSLSEITDEFRLCKSEYEIGLMRHAINASIAGHEKAMQTCRPGLHEYHLAAELHYHFQKHGCRSNAYSSIVGAGANACVLHYVQNESELRSGDLVLIDAGAEYENYAADITRAFPVNGKFSPEQKAVYEVVLAAQKAAIEVAKPGAAWNCMQEAILKTITAGLVDMGLLKGGVDSLIEAKAYLPFYMHNSGHWLGMDVHDVGSYKINRQWRTLQPNNVLTIEPGIYISANIPGVPEKWHNIGVRIEDDVRITDQGNEVLSKALVKDIADIEALMRA